MNIQTKGLTASLLHRPSSTTSLGGVGGGGHPLPKLSGTMTVFQPPMRNTQSALPTPSAVETKPKLQKAKAVEKLKPQAKSSIGKVSMQEIEQLANSMMERTEDWSAERLYSTYAPVFDFSLVFLENGSFKQCNTNKLEQKESENIASVESLKPKNSTAPDPFDLSASNSRTTSCSCSNTTHEEEDSWQSPRHQESEEGDVIPPSDGSRNNNATYEWVSDTQNTFFTTPSHDMTSVDDAITHVLSMSEEEFESTYSSVITSVWEVGFEAIENAADIGLVNVEAENVDNEEHGSVNNFTSINRISITPSKSSVITSTPESISLDHTITSIPSISMDEFQAANYDVTGAVKISKGRDCELINTSSGDCEQINQHASTNKMAVDCNAKCKTSRKRFYMANLDNVITEVLSMSTTEFQSLYSRRPCRASTPSSSTSGMRQIEVNAGLTLKDDVNVSKSEIGDFNNIQDVPGMSFQRSGSSLSSGSHISPIKLKKKAKTLKMNSTQENQTLEEVKENPENNVSPGVWVECVWCKKWRFLNDHRDPSELADQWHCGLQTRYLKNPEHKNACEEPEVIGEEVKDSDFVYGEFATGSIVLAKMAGYPEWPAMIDCDAEGKFAEHCPETGIVTRYRVVFLDPKNPTNQMVPAAQIRRISRAPEIKLDKKHAKYHQKLEAAISEAQKAIELSVEDRIFIYGYPYT